MGSGVLSQTTQEEIAVAAFAFFAFSTMYFWESQYGPYLDATP
jgi:hypothetical protein